MSEQVEGTRPAARAESAPSVDLVDVLEERVSALVHRYREARQTIQDLRTQLREREQRIGELNDKVYTLGRLKSDATRRIDRLIDDIQKVEKRVAARGER